MTLVPSVDAHTSGPVALDNGVSSDGKYLYVLTGDPLQAGTVDHVDVFSVGGQGQLTLIQTTASTMPENASGLQVN